MILFDINLSPLTEGSDWEDDTSGGDRGGFGGGGWVRWEGYWIGECELEIETKDWGDGKKHQERLGLRKAQLPQHIL